MKTFMHYAGPTPEAIALFAENRGIEISDKVVHPMEDSYLASNDHPIFVVADGVTLEFERNGSYPNPSPAGELAAAFCAAFIREAEAEYLQFSAQSMERAIAAGNAAAGEVNHRHGRTPHDADFFWHDIFAATAAGIVITHDTLFYFNLCDSGVTAWDKNGEVLYRSPSGWEHMQMDLMPPETSFNQVEKRKAFRRVFRNRLGKNGNLIGYGVATGEPDAMRYATIGSMSLDSVAAVSVHTDGYDHLVKVPDVAKLFIEWPHDLEQRFSQLERSWGAAKPDQFGHERSIIAVRL